MADVKWKSAEGGGCHRPGSEQGFVQFYVLIALILLGVLVASISSHLQSSTMYAVSLRQLHGREVVVNRIIHALHRRDVIRQSMLYSPELRACVEYDPSLAQDCSREATDDSLESYWDKSRGIYLWGHKARYFVLYDETGNRLTDVCYDLDGNITSYESATCFWSPHTKFRAICPGNAPQCAQAVAVKFFYMVSQRKRAFTGLKEAPGFGNHGLIEDGHLPYDSSPKPEEDRPYMWGDYYKSESPFVFEPNAFDPALPRSGIVVCQKRCGGAFSTEIGRADTTSMSNIMALGPRCSAPVSLLPVGTDPVVFCSSGLPRSLLMGVRGSDYEAWKNGWK